MPCLPALAAPSCPALPPPPASARAAYNAEGPEPEYQSDSAYPPWLFKLLEEKPILEDYIMMGLDKVPQEEMKRVYRMANKRRVKAGNDERRKE